MFAAVAILLAALVFGIWGLWRVWAPPAADLRAQMQGTARLNQAQREQIELLRQRVSTLGRSDQISRDANRDLQGTLAERDEELAGLRADVAFYERLVGTTAPRRGLTAHTLQIQPQETQPTSDSAWHFTSTLTQNLNRGAVSAGRLTLRVEGTSNGKLQMLDWSALRRQPDAPAVAYSFKYFQQVEGDIFLPPQFTPTRLTVRLQPQSGPAVEQSFTWDEARRGSNTSSGAGR
ncbi:MAG: hypothetical protein H0T88_09690 [Lysobacter sp.]|nr:hypothetical protein [Lysobacter sp.]